jgi:cellobiose phosphorylase
LKTEYSNTSGRFVDEGRAFVVTDPNAPSPWCNVVCNGRYGFVVSHRGGGFSWCDDAQHNVLTRWEMDLVRDASGKFLFLSDLESGAVWSAAPAPCGTRFDHYRCTHEAGATTFETVAHGVRTRWTLVVSASDNVEAWLVNITNESRKTRRLRASSYFEWTCGVAPDSKREFHRLFFTTRHDPRRRAILATKNMWDIPGKREKDHWNVPWPYCAAHAICGLPFDADLATADKKTFLGRYGSTQNPAAMNGDAPVGGFGRFGDACAALGGDFTLAPGQSREFHALLAIAEDEAGALALIDAHAEIDAPARVLEGARAAWRDRLSVTRVGSDLGDFDILTNHWLPYQAISGRLWGRTGYYQQSGAFGFRDQLQDSQVWLPVEPSRCADQIMLHATRQFGDGSVNHWWHALADFGNHTACSDDYLWLAFVTASYLRETGDFAILSRTAPWRDERGEGTLLDHCTRAIERAFLRLSPRGLPLIGSCDWNDGLSALGLEGRGESVWLAMFLCGVLREWETISARAGDASRAARSRTRREALERAVNQHAWDGAHYRCATKDSGEWIGASSSPEGKIHLNPQTWSILADVAPSDRRDIAWRSAKEKLFTPYGPLLLAPAYTTPDADIGYITRYSPGSRENGGVYMHAATWALAAACAMRDKGAATALWTSISPITRSAADGEAYVAEPYVLPGNVDGPLSDTPGRAGWTWYTGSAAWLRRVAMEWVLGVRPVWTREGEGLLIDPVPLAGMGKVEFERPWRGNRIRVMFHEGEWIEIGTARLSVNGREIAENVLSEADVSHAPGGVCEVRVRWSGTGGSATRNGVARHETEVLT